MRKILIVLAATGSLLAGIAAASPALAKSRPITLLCSPGSNGGTLVDGICVLPGAMVGLAVHRHSRLAQQYQALLAGTRDVTPAAGNRCKGGAEGRIPGGGRIQVFQRGHRNWDRVGKIRLPETVRIPPSRP